MTNPQPPYCKHWSDCGVAGGGCCDLGLNGGKPSYGVCERCNEREAGLGDHVARVLTAIGIKKCGGCSERQAMLNKAGERVAG